MQFSAKEICRGMSKPKPSDFRKLKKLARFLVGMREVRWNYEWQSEEESGVMRIMVDSDWAGCTATRRSTSGGAIIAGKHTLKTWATTQPTVALSSAEAEYYALVDGAARGLAIKNTVNELGAKMQTPIMTNVMLGTDSSSAKSFASRRGLGKMRHMEVKMLWLQNAVKDGQVI